MKDALEKEIVALQEELKKATTIDPDELDVLSRVVRDVTTLTSETIETSDEGEEHHALRERLEELTARFEVNHPHLATALERVINALASLGI